MNSPNSLPADYVKDLQRTVDFYSEQAVDTIAQFGLQHATDRVHKSVETPSFERIKQIIYTNWLALAMAACKFAPQLTPITLQLWQPNMLPQAYQNFHTSVRELRPNALQFTREFYFNTIIQLFNSPKPQKINTPFGSTLQTDSIKHTNIDGQNTVEILVGIYKASIHWTENNNVFTIALGSGPEKYEQNVADALLNEAFALSPCTAAEVSSYDPHFWYQRGFTISDVRTNDTTYFVQQLNTTGTPILQPLADIFDTQPVEARVPIIAALEQALSARKNLVNWLQQALPHKTAHVIQAGNVTMCNDVQESTPIVINRSLQQHNKPTTTNLRGATYSHLRTHILSRTARNYPYAKIAAAQRALITTVFSDVVNYPYPHWAEFSTSGTPMFAKQNRELNCFTAPWALASLLVQHGMDQENIFFCATNQIYNETARHNALLVILADGTIVFLDPITNVYSEALQCNFFGVAEGDAYNFLSNATTMHSFSGKFTKRTPEYRLPTAYHINRLQDGIAANYWLNMGNKLQEQIAMTTPAAEQQAVCASVQLAYETGLVHVPTHAHLLHNLGIHLWKQGQHASAKEHLQTASQQPIKAPITHVTLGDIACMEGDANTAMQHYNVFLKYQLEQNIESQNAERVRFLLKMTPEQMVTFVQQEA